MPASGGPRRTICTWARSPCSSNRGTKSSSRPWKWQKPWRRAFSSVRPCTSCAAHWPKLPRRSGRRHRPHNSSRVLRRSARISSAYCTSETRASGDSSSAAGMPARCSSGAVSRPCRRTPCRICRTWVMATVCWVTVIGGVAGGTWASSYARRLLRRFAAAAAPHRYTAPPLHRYPATPPRHAGWRQERRTGPGHAGGSRRSLDARGQSAGYVRGLGGPQAGKRHRGVHQGDADQSSGGSATGCA